jgi:hypothetical protein
MDRRLAKISKKINNAYSSLKDGDIKYVFFNTTEYSQQEIEDFKSSIPPELLPNIKTYAPEYQDSLVVREVIKILIKKPNNEPIMIR